MAVQSNIAESDNWFQGEAKTLEFSVKQSDGTTTQDITGWSLRWRLHDSPDDTTPVLTKATGGSGLTITNAAGGVCQVAITAADTTSLANRTYWHELWRTDSGNEALLSFGTAVLRGAAQ